MSDSPTDAFGDQPDRTDRPTAPDQLDTVWSALVEDLPPNQRAWLAASRPVTLHESTAIIAVADDFTRNQIEGRLRTRLEDALGASFDRQVRIAVTVDPELGGPDRAERPATAVSAVRPTAAPASTAARSTRPRRDPTSATTSTTTRR